MVEICRALGVVGLLACACIDRTIDAVDVGNGSGEPPREETGADATHDGAGSAECESTSPEGLTRCVEPARLHEDTTYIADIRVPGSTHWLAVQELCADRLAQLGYEVELHAYGTGTNVIGRRAGDGPAHELVLVGAHYDHIPGCLGADDNASGVAGVLEVARVLAEVATPRTLAIACWDEEELGLVGSRNWVDGGQRDGEVVVAYYNYDMIAVRRDEPGSQTVPNGLEAAFPEEYRAVAEAAFRGDFIVVVSDDLAAVADESIADHADALGLRSIHMRLDAQMKVSPLFADLQRSDHAPFWWTGIPALFLSDTGELRHDSYHCLGSEDTVETLDFQFAGSVVAATVGSVAETLGL